MRFVVAVPTTPNISVVSMRDQSMQSFLTHPLSASQRSLMTLPSRWFRAADKGVVSEGEKLLEEVRSNRGRLDVDLEDDDLHWTALGHAVIRGHHDYVRW